MLIGIIEQLELASTPDWHLVSEGDLPKEEGVYYCTDGEGNYLNLKFSKNIFRAPYKIVAWTELPKFKHNGNE